MLERSFTAPNVLHGPTKNRGHAVDYDTDTDPDADGFISILRIAARPSKRVVIYICQLVYSGRLSFLVDGRPCYSVIVMTETPIPENDKQRGKSE